MKTTADVQARVAQGRLRGTLSADAAVRSFKGVPYAAPPVGPLRWRAPQPPARWDGVRPATAYGPAAPQPRIPATSLYFAGDQRQSEDCLYLNVWGPADPDERRPVIVWLHIGAFLFGSGSAGPGPISDYDGEALARAGAVVVTVNYRLGRLGFLAHPWLTAESPDGTSGNYGLLDQIAALEWVRDNITAFGGDPGRVTIAGVSAGAASISALMSSPLARGLFHRAIAGSGGLFGPLADSCGINDLLQDLPAAERSGERLTRLLDVRALDELRALSPERLAAAHPPAERPFRMAFLPVPVGRGDFDTGWPIVDGVLLPASPYEVFRRSEQAAVPLLTGNAANEAAPMPGLDSTAAHIADARAEYGDLSDRFLRLYPAHTSAEAFAATTTANGDRVFTWQNWTWARLHARTATTYFYRWNHQPPIPPGTRYAEPAPGAFHASEIPYAFNRLQTRDWDWRPLDHDLARLLSGYWTAFAANGDPNGPGRPTWTPFAPHQPRALHMGATTTMDEIPHRARLDLLDEHYAHLRRNGR